MICKLTADVKVNPTGSRVVVVLVLLIVVLLSESDPHSNEYMQHLTTRGNPSSLRLDYSHNDAGIIYQSALLCFKYFTDILAAFFFFRHDNYENVKIRA